MRNHMRILDRPLTKDHNNYANIILIPDHPLAKQSENIATTTWKSVYSNLGQLFREEEQQLYQKLSRSLDHPLTTPNEIAQQAHNDRMKINANPKPTFTKQCNN